MTTSSSRSDRRSLKLRFEALDERAVPAVVSPILGSPSISLPFPGGGGVHGGSAAGGFIVRGAARFNQGNVNLQNGTLNANPGLGSPFVPGQGGTFGFFPGTNGNPARINPPKVARSGQSQL